MAPGITVREVQSRIQDAISSLLITQENAAATAKAGDRKVASDTIGDALTRGLLIVSFIVMVGNIVKVTRESGAKVTLITFALFGVIAVGIYAAVNSSSHH